MGRRPTKPKPDKPACAHRPIGEFSRIGMSGERIWTCSACGTQATWGETWRAFGAYYCKRCKAEDTIEHVTCSDACRAKVAAGALVTPATAPAKIPIVVTEDFTHNELRELAQWTRRALEIDKSGHAYHVVLTPEVRELYESINRKARAMLEAL